MYYKGLKDEENVTYVVGATNNISVNNQFSAVTLVLFSILFELLFKFF